MKPSLFLAIPISALLLTACGKSKSGSHSGQNNVSTNGICTQTTMDLHKDLRIKAKDRRGRNQTNLEDINQACINLYSFMGEETCQAPNDRRSREHKVISYSEVAEYCSEVSTYVGGSTAPSHSGNSGRPPLPPRPHVPAPHNPGTGRPSPVRPSPGPVSPGRFSIPVESLTSQFSVFFRNTRFIDSDLTMSRNRTSCVINAGRRPLHELTGARATIMAVVSSRVNGRATYDIASYLRNRNEIIRITCKSADMNLDLEDLNRVLKPAVEIRPVR